MDIKRNNVERIELHKIIFSDFVLKENDHQLYEKLRLSIISRGQLKNIVVCETPDGNYECLEGSKIVRILRELNEDTVNAINLGILSDEERDLIRIEISRDYFLTNYVCVGGLIKSIKQTMRIETICNTLPYTVRQSENLVKMSEFDWDDFNQNKQIEGQVSMFDIDVFEGFTPHQPHTEEEMTLEVTHEIDEVAGEEKELQPWQETVLEMTEDEPVVELFNVETEESSFIEPVELEVVNEEIESEQEDVEIEFNPVQETQEVLIKNEEGVFEEISLPIQTNEPVIEDDEELEIHNEYTNYYLNENDELVVLKHKEMVIEALPQIGENYILNKYGKTDIIKKELKMHEIEGIAYVSAVVLITKYGVVYRLKPSQIIETLLEFVDIVDNSDQQTLF